MRRTRPLLLALLAAVVGLCASGCVNVGALQFTQDHRLTFTSPERNALVTTPIGFTWTMDDFSVLTSDTTEPPSKDAGWFAVFVDQAPIKPGRTLADVGKDDPACTSDPHCPDLNYLAAKGVYVTHKPSIKIDNVLSLVDKLDIQQHQVTVVLLDSSGHRIGESSWFQEFRMKNSGLG